MLQSHFDAPTTAPVPTAIDSESWTAKLTREINVVGGGTLTGMANGIAEAEIHPLQFTANLAGTVGLVLSLRGPAPLRAVASGAAVLGSLMFAKETYSSLHNAAPVVADVWRSDKNTAVNMAYIQRELGPLAFDTALMGLTGAATAKMLEAPSIWKSWSKSDMVPRVVQSNGLPIEIIGYRHAANYYSAHDSLVRLTVTDKKGGRSGGTGFYVSDDGMIVTARHVLIKGIDPQTTKIETHLDGVGRDAQVLIEDPVNDLAILQVIKNHPDESFKSLTIADKVAGQGMSALSIGFPGSERAPLASPGRMIEKITINKDRAIPNPDEGLGEGADKNKMTVLAPDGMSGGPVLNARGMVIGVTTHRNITHGKSTMLATPVESLASLISAAHRISREILVRDPQYGTYELYGGGKSFDMPEARPLLAPAAEMLNRAVVQSRITPEDGEAFLNRFRNAPDLAEVERIAQELSRWSDLPR